MTIKLFSGTPGSGKSLHTASKIYYSLRAGRPVIANFDVNVNLIPKSKTKQKGQFLMIDNNKLNPALLRDFSENYFNDHFFQEEKILLIIDESQILFNSRAWNSKGRDDWIWFFSNHRKYGYEIILIAQFDRMLDRQIRALIEYEFIHRKVSNYGYKGKAMSLVAGGNLFVSVEVWYPMKEKVGSEFFKAKKKFYSLYDTYNKFDN